MIYPCLIELPDFDLAVVLEVPFPPQKGMEMDFAHPDPEGEYTDSIVLLTTVIWCPRIAAFHCFAEPPGMQSSPTEKEKGFITDCFLALGWRRIDEDEEGQQHPEWQNVVASRDRRST